MSNTLFPIFLKTEKIKILIIGGGLVSLEKVETLTKQNPNIAITIVAKAIYPALQSFLSAHTQFKITVHERDFIATDLDNITIVISATNDAVLNAEIKKLANNKKLLLNAADQPDLCDFYLGSIVNKGNMKIAISTNGKSPVLARRMREYFTDIIPDDIDDTLENLNKFRASIKGDFNQRLINLNQATNSLSKRGTDKKQARKYKRLVLEISLLFVVFFIGYGVSTFVSIINLQHYVAQIPNAFYGMLAVGFFAQLVDGALGLGYGITSATSMMLLGIKLPAISGSIHIAEMFSSGISGFSHYKFGNVNKKLLFWLAVPGVIGAVCGACALLYLGNTYESFAYAILATYTMIIGIRLVFLALRPTINKQKIKHVGVLGFVGAFLDAFGGGGWGPIVTSTLLSKGRKSSFVVGTVSLAEFFVTLAAAITFFSFLGVSHWYIIAGLILGGTLAAPIAAKLAGKLPRKTALLLVAALVIVFSVRMLLKLL